MASKPLFLLYKTHLGVCEVTPVEILTTCFTHILMYSLHVSLGQALRQQAGLQHPTLCPSTWHETVPRIVKKLPKTNVGYHLSLSDSDRLRLVPDICPRLPIDKSAQQRKRRLGTGIVLKF